MELREAVGRRRSIRWLLPHKPVEQHKIQRMLEAARLASFWGNVQGLRAIVIYRDQAPSEVLAALPSPVSGFQISLAPVAIVWFFDSSAVDAIPARLRELVDVGAIGYGENKQDALEKGLIPVMSAGIPFLKEPGLNDLDCGQGIAQATLMAFEQGLGTCCMGMSDPDRVRRRLGLPEHCRVLVTQTVGYPAESPEAGGQRPRPPFQSMFFLNTYGNPFPREEEVVAELERDGMIQAQGPLPWREAELQFLQDTFGLEGNGLLEWHWKDGTGIPSDAPVAEGDGHAAAGGEED
jgi:nitroreductase